MPHAFIQCRLCSSVQRSFPSLWAHYRSVHQPSEQVAIRQVQEEGDALEVESGVNAFDTPHNNESLESPGSEVTDIGLERQQRLQDRLENEDVTKEVLNFYESLPQHSTPLVAHDDEPYPPLQELPEHVQLMVRYCMTRQMSRSQLSDLYEMVSEYDRRRDKEAISLSDAFPNKTSFICYISGIKKSGLRGQGWMKAHIEMCDGQVNRSGCYRSPLDLAEETIELAGGSTSIIPFNTSHSQDGHRTYSGPLDGESYEEYSTFLTGPGKVLLVDVYADGLSLPGNGTQSLTPVRVRFPNLRGYQCRWFDVGIEPVYTDHGVARPRTQKTVYKRELFQRFLYMVFKDLMRASESGFIVDGCLIYPRLNMINCDQKQERQFLCLRSAGGTRSCSHCDMMFIMTRSHQGTNATTVSYATDESDEGVQAHQTQDDTESIRNALTGYTEDNIRREQLSGKRARDRKITEVIRFQLLLAKLMMDSRYGTGGRVTGAAAKQRRAAMAFLKKASALEFPPAFAGFSGCGSIPFRLYCLIGLDKLHNFDIGMLRMLMEGVLPYFRSSPRCTVPTATAVTVVNQRLLDMPRLFHLPKLSIIPSGEGQLQPGMTGKVRRDVSCVLPFCILGVCTGKPDDDELLQLSLLADSVNQLLCGTNVTGSRANLTASDIETIQSACSKFSLDLCNVLGIKVNTKTHRIMYHVSDHLYNFGTAVWGSNDANETLHKYYKHAYKFTNRHHLSLAPQILAAHSVVQHDATKYQAEDEEGEIRAYTPCSESCVCRQELISTSIDTLVNQVAMILCDNLTVEERMSRLAKQRTSFRSTTWKSFRRLTFKCQLPWVSPSDTNINMPQTLTVHEFDSSASVQSYDGILFKDDESVCSGIIQSIVSLSSCTCRKYFVVRRLVEVEADVGNERIVHEFGHIRLKYLLNFGTDVELSMVPFEDMIHPIALVVDAYDYGRRHSMLMRLGSVPDTTAERKELRFFRVKGWKLSTFKEKVEEEGSD